VTYTFIIEGIGAVLLSTGFMFEGKPFFYSIYLGIFHSISAFCNAGFSIFDESLIGSSIFVKIVISTLIICGGLGFYVIYDLYNFRRGRKTYRIHTRLVLITTMVLILTGTLAIKLIETHKAFDISWIDAYFQSVTTRTAGFNSVDLTLLHPSSILIMTVLMLIGASPGSTGGGMKTTTAAVIFISIYNTFKGNPTVMIFRRRIPLSSILKAFSIMFTFILLTIIGVIAIAGVENTTLSVAVFEAVSALGTVGLSLGLTAQAGAMTKIVLIILMFVGRVGPFTFFLFLLSREKSSQIEYPEERVIMG
jgi:trk system potassium uptake protein TrkH